MGVLSGLEPAKVFEYFEKICSVPHGSGNTARISSLVCEMLNDMGVKHVQDASGNIIAFKPASSGYEGHEPVILQGHMDMVCAKDEGCTKDMSTEGLDLTVSDRYIRAKGTSLGGDDGIAVAMILALLSDDSLMSPPIEAVFTVDEEIGMDGARALDMSLLSGRRMINLDSEEEGVFTVSCAGGVRVDGAVPVLSPLDEADDGNAIYRVSLFGLKGGHSGCEIDKGRGNAIKLLARVMYWATKKYGSLRLSEFTGGKFDNVICDSCEAVISLKTEDTADFESFIAHSDQTLKREFESTDPGIKVKARKICEEKNGRTVFSAADTLNFVRLLCVLPFGVRAMSRDVEGLVQTSSNIGMVATDGEGLHFTCSVRSSYESQKEALAGIIEAACEQAGGHTSRRGDYPGWEFLKESPLRDVLCKVYKEKTGKEPVITAIHAGLECGLFAGALKGLDCVSIGPEMHGIHSPEERLGIESVGRLYDLVRTTLKNL
ncbi:MAG: aminoacyl-histidine dipeptidase [Lachnospiraceae bacterium]|nr:aminoacyl-histidine dipeptidase [Lachnospiraceae bacterium]